MNPISPLILQAQISPPAGGGSFGLADSTKLENPFQGPMWLDEIRFKLPGSEAGTLDTQAWSRLAVELKLGETPLTNGYVPISLLGKVLNDSESFGENSGGATVSPGAFTWKLPKPLFIPAREFLRPTMYFQPYSGAPAKVVTIMYVCRPLPKGTPPPLVMQIPWVTYFKPPDLSCALASPATDTTNDSTPADLYNPWDEELHVQRFVGRLMGQNYGENQNHMSIASANINLTTEALASGTLVSAQDSFNNILIRDRTPFAHVFDFLDRAWTVNCILAPKGFYLFTVDRLWSGYLPSEAFVATIGISMVGWREVSIQRQNYGVPVDTSVRRGR